MRLCGHETAVGEPPLLLAGSVYSAVHSAIDAARKDYNGGKTEVLELNPPATVENVKRLCGYDNVERYFESVVRSGKAPHGKLM